MFPAYRGSVFQVNICYWSRGWPKLLLPLPHMHGYCVFQVAVIRSRVGRVKSSRPSSDSRSSSTLTRSHVFTSNQGLHGAERAFTALH